MELGMFVMLLGVLMMVNVLFMLHALFKGWIGTALASVLVHFIIVFGPMLYILIFK